MKVVGWGCSGLAHVPQQLSWEPSPLVVLQGPNGGGKTQLVRAWWWLLRGGDPRHLGLALQTPHPHPYPPTAKVRAWLELEHQGHRLRLIRRWQDHPEEDLLELEAPQGLQHLVAQLWQKLRVVLTWAAEAQDPLPWFWFHLEGESLARDRFVEVCEQAWAPLAPCQVAQAHSTLERLAHRLWHPRGYQGIIAQLLVRRRQLLEQLEHTAGQSSRFELIWQRLEKLEEELHASQSDLERLEQQHRACQVAQQLRPQWEHYRRVQSQLEQIPRRPELTSPKVHRTRRALRTLKRVRTRLRRLKHELAQRRKQLRSLPPAAPPRLSWPQLVLLLQQQEVLHTLQQQLQQAQQEVEKLQQALGDQHTADSPDSASKLSASQIEQLRQLHGQLEHHRRVCNRLEEQLAQVEDQLQHAQEQSTSSENRSGEQNRQELKRRIKLLEQQVQLHQRYGELRQQLEELEEEFEELLDRQVLPRWAEVGLGVGFALCGAVALGGLFFWGWVWFLLGVLAAGGIWVGKRWWVQHSLARLQQSEAHIQQLQQELQQLQPQVQNPPKGLDPNQGPWELQLQKAQEQLALLEPNSSQHSNAQALQRRWEKLSQQLERHHDQLQKLQEQWAQICRRWSLPLELDPQQLVPNDPQQEQLRQQLQQAKGRYEQLRQRHQLWQQQVAQLAQQMNLPLGPGALGPQLAQLHEQLRQAHQQAQQRRNLVRSVGRLRRLGRKLRSLRSRALRWCHRMMVQLDLETLAQLHSLVRQALQREKLQAELQHLRAQLTAEAKQVPLELVEELAGLSPSQLQRQQDELCEQLKQLRQHLQQLQAQAQLLREQREQMLQDTTAGELQAQLLATEHALQSWVRRWAMVLWCWHALDRASRDWEQHHVPEFLEQVGQLLGQMTAGWCHRAGLCAQRHALWVQSHWGQRLPVEALSEATAEQFRLAWHLATWRRLIDQGVQWPLVLDEPLTRADSQRLQSTAEVLARLSSQGQVVLATAQASVAQALQQCGATVVELAAGVAAKQSCPSETPPEPLPEQTQLQETPPEPSEAKPSETPTPVASSEPEPESPSATQEPPEQPSVPTSDWPGGNEPEQVPDQDWDAEEFEGELRDEVYWPPSSASSQPEAQEEAP